MVTKNPSTVVEPQTAADVDALHPAVDDDLRANTSDEQNRIDFNDPTISGRDAVAQALGGADAK